MPSLHQFLSNLLDSLLDLLLKPYFSLIWITAGPFICFLVPTSLQSVSHTKTYVVLVTWTLHHIITQLKIFYEFLLPIGWNPDSLETDKLSKMPWLTWPVLSPATVSLFSSCEPFRDTWEWHFHLGLCILAHSLPFCLGYFPPFIPWSVQFISSHTFHVTPLYCVHLCIIVSICVLYNLSCCPFTCLLADIPNWTVSCLRMRTGSFIFVSPNS